MDWVSYRRRYDDDERLVIFAIIEQLLMADTLIRIMVYGQAISSGFTLLFHGIQLANSGCLTTVDVVRAVSCLFGGIGNLLQKPGRWFLVVLAVLIMLSCRRFFQSTYYRCSACFQTVIHRIHKFHSLRKERKRISKATIKIQSVVRRFLAQKFAGRLRAKKEERKRKATIKIQSVVRRFLAHKLAERLRAEKEERKRINAIKIQSVVRRFLAQKLAERLRAEQKLNEIAVKDIQRTVDELGERAASDLPYYHPARVYKNFSVPKGLVLIINNVRFVENRDRTGADVDERNIRQLWDKLGYNVLETRENLTAELMLDVGRHFAQDVRHSGCHSCIVVVMTHGDYDTLYVSDDAPLNIHEFFECFNALAAPSLAGKPKLFLIQACRGGNRDPGVLLEVPEDEADTPVLWRQTSIHPDFLVAYSTVPHFNSWRNPANGSWFIQSVCAIFSEHAYSEPIGSMLEMVQKRVSEQYEAPGNCKQCPEHINRLLKTFHFFPGVSKEER